jgi:hypothetical protein
MSERLPPIFRGPWKVTPTVHTNRRNLFSLARQTECHIATIVSGSSSEIDRFDAYLSVIEASPDMLEVLLQTLRLLDEYAFVENSRAQATANKIRALLHRVRALGIQG